MPASPTYTWWHPASLQPMQQWDEDVASVLPWACLTLPPLLNVPMCTCYCREDVRACNDTILQWHQEQGLLGGPVYKVHMWHNAPATGPAARGAKEFIDQPNFHELTSVAVGARIVYNTTDNKLVGVTPHRPDCTRLAWLACRSRHLLPAAPCACPTPTQLVGVTLQRLGCMRPACPACGCHAATGPSGPAHPPTP
jgi:hypothetical protein